MKHGPRLDLRFDGGRRERANCEAHQVRLTLGTGLGEQPGDVRSAGRH